MILRNRYLLTMIALHGMALALAFAALRAYPVFFILAELVVLASLFHTWRLYRQFVNPFLLLSTGVDAIQDRDFNLKFVLTGKPEIDRLIRVYNTMIDQLRNERTQQEAQHFFLSKLIATAPAGILILDYDDYVVDANPKLCEWTGINLMEIHLRPLGELTHPLFKEIAKVPSGESRMVQLSGAKAYKCQRAHFIDRGFPRHFIVVEELSLELLQAEKNAYGKVIRMMAHEVNNSIGAINGVLTLLRNKQPELSPSYLQALEVCIDRNDRLNRFMRNFADVVRLPPPQRDWFDLNALLTHLKPLLEGMSGVKPIQWYWSLHPHPVKVFADKHQIEQVFINIIKNAVEAIEGEGQITIYSSTNPAILLIQNTGMGIPPEIENQLFTPFFSTKKDGQGIGLTLIREILLQHGFGFRLHNIEQGKTEFSIEFKLPPLLKQTKNGADFK